MTALDRLSLDIGPGVTGLVGANGAGKSTMIKILLGLSPATEGRAEVLGLDVTSHGPAIREQVGYMPEHDCLPPDVSATEFVVHMARMSGLPPAAARERTADTLRHVGLYEERYRPMGGYSTGMKQRVSSPRPSSTTRSWCSSTNPPTAWTPSAATTCSASSARVWTEFGISVLVTSHLLGELERTCDHVVVIDGGRLAALQLHQRLHPDHHHRRRRGHRLRHAPRRHRRPPHRPHRRRSRPPHARRGRTAGRRHILLLEATGEETYDIVRDTVADLGLGLVRMEQRRHHIAEVFRPEAAAAGTSPEVRA